jgi:hypothetical protein
MKRVEADRVKTEIGGGNTGSCQTYLCQAISFLNTNSDGGSLLLYARFSKYSNR